MKVATFPPHLSMGLHGGCHVSTTPLHGTPWRFSPLHTSRGTPRVRPDPVVTGTERFSYNTCPKADQNCADLMRAEQHVTRRDVVSSQTEGNSVSVVEDVLRVDRFSHKIVQVHQ